MSLASDAGGKNTYVLQILESDETWRHASIPMFRANACRELAQMQMPDLSEIVAIVESGTDSSFSINYSESGIWVYYKSYHVGTFVPLPTFEGKDNRSSLWKLNLRNSTTTSSAELVASCPDLQLDVEEGEQVSINVVQGWLARCDKYDSPFCRPPDSSTSAIVLTYIDVVDECLKTVEEVDKYVTLSYVWGDAVQLKTSRQNNDRLHQRGALASDADLGGKIPRTIRDAMYFVKALDLRYLWVDCLCIVQDDERQKQELIKRMDSVYMGSYLTLANLAGRNANDRLPGSCPGSRPAQPTLTKDGKHFVAVPHNLIFSLPCSPYELRAWTFQERLLSRRCLFFSSTQVWFHCQRGFECEIRSCMPGIYTSVGDINQLINHPRHLRDTDPHRYRPSYSTKEFISIYESVVADYTTRALSYDRDALNAITGVLAALGESYLCGIPDLELHEGLMWAGAGPLSRRVEDAGDGTTSPLLPSWSWAAWSGGIRWPFSGAKSSIRSMFKASLRSQPSIIYRPHEFLIQKWPSVSLLGEIADAENFGLRHHELSSPDRLLAWILDAGSEKCGILFLNTLDMLELNLTTNFHFIVISSGMSLSDLGGSSYVSIVAFAAKYPYPGLGLKFCNVMLVRKQGQIWERVTVGVMHPLALSEAGLKTGLIVLGSYLSVRRTAHRTNHWSLCQDSVM